MAEDSEKFQELVANVAAAYFANTHVNVADIQTAIGNIASGLLAAAQTAVPDAPAPEEAPIVTRATPAQIRKSITPAALVSFEDGRPYKTLRRHLTTRGLTIDQYREKWGLPADYPTVAPDYSAQRSAMAKKLGLGARGRGASRRGRGK